MSAPERFALCRAGCTNCRGDHGSRLVADLGLDGVVQPDARVVRDFRASSAVLRDPRFGRGVDAAEEDGHPRQRSFLTMNPPDHTRLRRLVSYAFTPSSISRLEPRIERLATELVDAALAAPHGEVDLVAAMAAPLPVVVICELLGVPVSDRERFTAWSHAVARGLDPAEELSAQELTTLGRARQELRAYFAGLVDAKRHRPADDLTSRLVAVRDTEQPLSEEEMISTLVLLLIAGHETTVNLIGNGAFALLRNPDQMSLLRARPELIGQAVEEFLRFEPPVQYVSRVALEAAEVGGRRVEPGHRVVVHLSGANRDPAESDDPERLDVTRSSPRHLSFGAGIHFCLGAPLARLESRVAFTVLLARTASIEATGEAVWRRNKLLHGLERLPVRMAPALRQHASGDAAPSPTPPSLPVG